MGKRHLSHFMLEPDTCSFDITQHSSTRNQDHTIQHLVSGDVKGLQLIYCIV